MTCIDCYWRRQVGNKLTCENASSHCYMQVVEPDDDCEWYEDEELDED